MGVPGEDVLSPVFGKLKVYLQTNITNCQIKSMLTQLSYEARYPFCVWKTSTRPALV